MRKTCKWITGLLFLIISIQPLWAKEKTTVGILPFVIHSAENIEYVRQGIGEMLISRISGQEKIEVIGRESVRETVSEKELQNLSASNLDKLGEKLGADFLVWGSITKIGNSLSIDAKLADITAGKTVVNVYAQCPTMDEVIPQINDFAQKIVGHILGSMPQTMPSPPPSKEIVAARQPSGQTSREAEIISGMRGGRKGTFTSSINPDFINAAQPLDRKTFWKSQQFMNEFRGMDIGDVNGDGLKETVIIDSHNILVYQRKDGAFKKIEQISGKSYDYYVGLDVSDINGNGIPEIIVSSYAGQQVDSFVVEFRDGRFVTIASGLPWFLRVINNSSGVPVLLGQRRGIENPFDTQIHEIVWQSGEYREGKRMRIPQGLSVYGLTLDKIGSSGAERIIALNESDYLYIYDQTDKPLSKIAVFGGSDELIWKSDDVFGGSNTIIEPVNKSADSTMEIRESYFINLRILTYDTNGDGKREIIIVKNLSSAGRLMQNVKLFTSAEVYNLEWDGLGMVENWRTRKINGYVADYQFKDIDNDGENEIVLALVLSTVGTVKDRSVIVAYDLRGE
mgnify:FL=1